MPELSRFEGMTIYMLFRDNKEHNKPLMFMSIMANIKLLLASMENY